MMHSQSSKGAFTARRSSSNWSCSVKSQGSSTQSSSAFDSVADLRLLAERQLSMEPSSQSRRNSMQHQQQESTVVSSRAIEKADSADEWGFFVDIATPDEERQEGSERSFLNGYSAGHRSKLAFMSDAPRV